MSAGKARLPLLLGAFYDAWAKSTRRTLTVEQRSIVAPASGPVWGTAGPGSGKSETLAARALRLLLASEPLPEPASLMITTFTNKAAENLKSRLTDRLTSMGFADSLDLSLLWVGTLHSLCDRIMRDYRYPPYQGLRLMDEVEQAMFIHRYATIVKESDVDFWRYWSCTLPQQARYKLARDWAPSAWEKTRAAITLFNRLSEDNLDQDQLGAAGEPAYEQLDQYWQDYQAKLKDYSRCDFGLVQRYFLEFLDSPYGRLFVEGAPDRKRPPLLHILVDEYQDTNPIQEAIYFKLAGAIPGKSLTVVGDDDQALYRFRGGTVEALVKFGERCEEILEVAVQPKQLRANYRSHDEIVNFFNRYIDRPEMEGGRAPDKQPMKPQAGVSGGPGVVVLTGTTADDTAARMANVINQLAGTNKIMDWSEVAVLFRSTKETARAAGKYVGALRSLGIPVYNPRSRALLDAEEVQVALGALIALVDPGLTVCNNPRRTMRSEVETVARRWYQAYQTLPPNSRLRAWIERAAQADKRGDSRTLREEFYHILNQAPFAGSDAKRGWLEDPERNFRLGRITQLLEGYSRAEGRRFDREDGQVSYADGDNLRLDKEDSTRIDPVWVESSFYRGLIEYLETFKANDPEDPEMEVVSGRVQIMTVHQSKGLEFPYVFVVGLQEDADPEETALVLEDRFAPFRLRPTQLQDPTTRSMQDVIRYYYVAYSRAIQALILVDRRQAATNGELWFPV